MASQNDLYTMSMADLLKALAETYEVLGRDVYVVDEDDYEVYILKSVSVGEFKQIIINVVKQSSLDEGGTNVV